MIEHTHTKSTVLCLASASPRRQELLRQITVEYAVAAADIDESWLPGEAPGDYVQRLARTKAFAVAGGAAAAGLPVLGADTSVVLGQAIFGKPADAADAHRMLSRLAGCEHQVMSAVALVKNGTCHERLSISRVRFAPLSEAQIDRYIASGEPFGKAGAYAIQGRAAIFVEHLQGSYSGVMGLPLFETAQLLAAAGVVIGGDTRAGT